MSIDLANRAEDAVNAAYVVAPPRVGDALADTLRAAFGVGHGRCDAFDTLLRRIDQAARPPH